MDRPGVLGRKIIEHDRRRHEKLVALEASGDNRVFLFRGANLWKEFRIGDRRVSANPEWGAKTVHVQHMESLRMSGLKLEPDAVQHGFVETFEKIDAACAGCGGATYRSKNYLQLPEWLYRDEWEAKWGLGTWNKVKGCL